MSSPHARRISLLAVFAIGIFGVMAAALDATAAVACCPFCGGPTVTLTEQFSMADAAALVTWSSGTKPGKGEAGDALGSTVYEVVRAVRDPEKSLEKGSKITLIRYREGKPGDLCLLLGSKINKAVEWGSPLEVTETTFNYIIQAPPSESPAAIRLSYFLKFLEYPDQGISNDAYAEFANASYKDIIPLAKTFPRDKLRKWVSSNEREMEPRLGLYGMMLGLCGETEDAQMMEDKISQTTNEPIRIGIDGVIGGYLLLKGEPGLEFIERTRFVDKKAPFSESFAALQALRFMWTYGNGRISPDRLKAAARLLLDRPELADFAINDLTRWKDWSIQDRLMELHGSERYNINSIKRLIIRYMIASTRDVPSEANAPKPEHAIKGAKYLDELREKDPRNYKEVERFPF